MEQLLLVYPSSSEHAARHNICAKFPIFFIHNARGIAFAARLEKFLSISKTPVFLGMEKRTSDFALQFSLY